MPKFTSVFREYAPWILVALLSVGLQPNAFSQSSSASLTVDIADTTGAVVPNAGVVIRNMDTNQEQRSASGKSGNATFSFLKPGHYALTVSKDNFADVAVSNIVLNVGVDRHVELTLKVGSADQTVTVDGAGPTINTSDGSVSTVVDRNFVENMPLNGRSFQDLILLTPGVTTSSPQQGGTSGSTGEFSVNGQRTESNVYMVDGVNANTGGYTLGLGTPGTSGSLPSATALGTTQSLVSVDDLQEFRVSSSSYSAEYGLSPGGQFSFQTRSGTNDLHGSAFDYLRNNALDANNWFNDNTTPITPKTAERQNDFGGTIGGPILLPRLYDGRNRSFFFFSYEGLRLTQPQAALTTYVPSMSLRETAPAVIQPALDAFPVPTGPALSNGLAPFVGASSSPSSLDSTSVRFDQQLGQRFKLFFRFADTQSSTESRSTLGLSEVDRTSQSSYTNTFGMTTIFSPTSTNDLRLNYTSTTGTSSNMLDSFGGAQPADLLQLQGVDASKGPAYSNFALYFPGYETALTQQHSSQPQDSLDINDGTTFAFGRHTLKVGADFRRTASTLAPWSPLLEILFNSSTGVINNQSEYGVSEIKSASYPAYKNVAAYIQDELRANQKLNLSLGLRWEVNPPPGSTNGPLPYAVVGNPNVPSSLSLAPEGSSFWKTTYYNFAPRFGLAYHANDKRGSETVIRAGGGVFFDSGQQQSTQAFANGIGKIAEALYFGASYPLTPAQVNVPVVSPPVAPYNAQGYYYPEHTQIPYTLKWNLSIEQALGASQTFTLSYIGSNGRRLLSQQELTGVSAFPDGVFLQSSGNTSSYNALQAKYQRTLSRGLQVLASYNWAHSIDFGSQNIAYAQIRGNSDFDLRNNFNLAATYEIPKLNSEKVVDAIVNRWSLDTRFAARGGFPVILDGNSITLPSGQSAYSGLNLVPNVPVYLHVRGLPGDREINPAAFSLPAKNTYGNAPRNFVRGFGMNELDLGVRRTFPIVERLNLQFRAEMFNLLNRPDFGYIQPKYGNPQFGQAAETLNESLTTLSSIYQQGGPRSMQMSLRLEF